MPVTSILFYQEKEGDAPVVDWLNELKRKNPKGFLSCVDSIAISPDGELLASTSYNIALRI